MIFKAFTKEEKDVAFRKLPTKAQNLFMSKEFEDIFKKTTKDFGLRVDQMGILADEVYLATVGLRKLEDLAPALSKSGKFQNVPVSKIIENLNEKFFKPIHKSVIEPGTGHKPVREAANMPGDLPGVERTMPRDIMKAKLSQQTQTKVETKKIDGKQSYTNDPYREPVE